MQFIPGAGFSSDGGYVPGAGFIKTSSVSLSYLTPISDISSGSWTPSTGATLYGVLDEAVADSGDYIQTTTNTDTCEVKLASGGGTVTAGNLKYRLEAGTGTVTVNLVQTSTVLYTFGPHTLTGAVQDFTQSVSGITNDSDLRVRFTSGT
jgi:hypothetical protein